jgi:hypothetical protein
MIRTIGCVLVVAWAVGSMSTGGAAQKARGSGDRPTAIPQLYVHAHSLPPTYSGVVSAGWSFTDDRTNSSYIAAGTTEFPDPCALAGGDVVPGTEAGPDPGAFVAWQVDSRLKSVDAAGATFTLHWTRTVRDRNSVEADSMERQYDVRLAERERQVLDLVRTRGAAYPNCDGVALELELTFEDDPSVANTLLEYDVWLVHRDRQGRELTDHVQPRGFQGRSVEYAFRPIKYRDDGSIDSAGGVTAALTGSVKGRVRPDGRIDLVVSAARMVMSRALGSGDGGSKQATVADGETIELETPRLRGRLPVIGDLEPFFEGDRTAIRVTARRVN